MTVKQPTNKRRITPDSCRLCRRIQFREHRHMWGCSLELIRIGTAALKFTLFTPPSLMICDDFQAKEQQK